MSARFVLWDVDGTLLTVRGHFRPVLLRAASDVLGRECVLDGVQAAGRTDPSIARQILERNGVEIGASDALVDRLIERYEALALEERGVCGANATLFPGVVEALTLLRGAGVVNTVLTGNIEPVAELKLDAVGIRGHLDLSLGAYGSDAEDRNELVAVALDRAERETGLRFEQDDVWIVGDTPHDLEAARSNGVRCALVATGSYGLEELAPLGADALLEDLSDLEAVRRAFA